MTADASAADRAYGRLKADILRGAFDRTPLDIRKMGDRLRMSATPVREALQRLCTERLVRHASHGYAIVRPSARRLEQLYEISGAIAAFTVECARRTDWPAPASQYYSPVSTYADGLTALLADLASHQKNLELMAYLSGVGDRLYAARRAEPKVFPEAHAELDVLHRFWNARNFSALSGALRDHHVTRAENTDALARHLSDEAEDP